MSALFNHVDQLMEMRRGHDSFACPHCGHEHSISDSDVCVSVVSYWGDDAHEFSCWECGKDFVVKEDVTRQFETAKSHDDFDN